MPSVNGSKAFGGLSFRKNAVVEEFRSEEGWFVGTRK